MSLLVLSFFHLCYCRSRVRNGSLSRARAHSVHRSAWAACARVRHARPTHSNFHENTRKRKKNSIRQREKEMEKAYFADVSCMRLLAEVHHVRARTVDARTKYNLFYSNSSDKRIAIVYALHKLMKISARTVFRV